MKLTPVALAVFYQKLDSGLAVWTQTRVDDGPFHGLLEFPGGGIEIGEEPLAAAVREVYEEVGINVRPEIGKLMGIYPQSLSARTILLYVFIFPYQDELKDRGEWLIIKEPDLSAPLTGKIPPANHKIIDDLFMGLKD